MPDDLTFTWEKLENLYLADNIEYKDQARKLISTELGFEPDLRASMEAELRLRKMLKRHAEGTMSEKTLSSNIEAYSNVIRARIKKNIPEQYHLVKDYETAEDFLNRED